MATLGERDPHRKDLQVIINPPSLLLDLDLSVKLPLSFISSQFRMTSAGLKSGMSVIL
jgi:hypothetical protein